MKVIIAQLLEILQLFRRTAVGEIINVVYKCKQADSTKQTDRLKC